MSTQRPWNGVVFYVGLGLALVVVIAINESDFALLPPKDWLEKWTAWVGTVVGIVVAARVLWAGASALQRWAAGNAPVSGRRTTN
ncbi:MAG TPA: hypothetical protein VH763_08180 [Gemmatimonadales bacterium]|jgi:hypothetical protein